MTGLDDLRAMKKKTLSTQDAINYRGSNTANFGSFHIILGSNVTYVSVTERPAHVKSYSLGV